MNCEKFQTVACDLARNEIMEASERASALAHIDECERCGQAWSNQRELSEGLRNVARQMDSLQAPVELEGKLLAAFRDHGRVRPSRVAVGRRRYWVAAAAAVLIAFGILAWRAQVAVPARPAIDAKVKPGDAVPLETPKRDQSAVVAGVGDQRLNQSAPPKQDEPDSQPRRSVRVNRKNAAAVANRPVADSASGLAGTPVKEITTDFVALGYANELDLQDGGQLLRVELPRSALARFGLPVNMDRVDERVKADLLVGADGLARAIRFVK